MCLPPPSNRLSASYWRTGARSWSARRQWKIGAQDKSHSSRHERNDMSNNPKPWIESVHLHPDVLKEKMSVPAFSFNPKPWIESVHLHPDVLKENAGTDIFALD